MSWPAKHSEVATLVQNFGGAQPPDFKVDGAQAPPYPSYPSIPDR